jgi:predicted ATP-dependent serine protease
MQTVQTQPTLKKRGRPSKKGIQNATYVPSIINFDNKVSKLSNLNIDPRMMKTMKTGLGIDELFSHEYGIPAATNIMMIGDPGVGKTTVLLDVLASAQNKGAKCLFISGEMGKKQMFKYTERFKQFGVLETLFMQDFLEYNTKDVIEQVLDRGYDLVLIDSAAEIIEGVRDDNNWDRKMAESWLVDICVKNNKGENKSEKFTSFLLIQQITKGGSHVGSNKLKHLVDAAGEMRRESESQGGSTYINFVKNRNGLVDNKIYYQISNNSIRYGTIIKNTEDQ